MNPTEQIFSEKFSFTSSIAADVWHPKPNAEAYEWWYFDALSEDGRDAIVIIFLDNFIFSPGYNRLVKSSKSEAGSPKPEVQSPDLEIDLDSVHLPKIQNPKSKIQNFPAVAFTYYRDGKPKYRAINEFPIEEFVADADVPSCRMGENFFRLESAPYGSGYVLSINAKFRKNRHLKADFEWLSIESDFLPDKPIRVADAHSWNLAVSRADVTGRISVSSEKGKNTDIVHFRGTGYHDHNFDNRWLPETVSDWQWGRAHFADATAVFYRYKEIAQEKPTTKIFIVRDETLREFNASYEEQNFSRDIFGIKYPKRLSFASPEDNLRLSVKQTEIIDSSFFYLRFLSEMELTSSDGKTRKTTGITEYLAPKALKFRWLDWLVNMRIGRNGKGSFLP